MSNPSVEHLKYLDYVFSYLVKTKNLGLDLTLQSALDSTTKTNNCISLLVISDADWGGDLDSRKSTSGNFFTLQSNNKLAAIS